MRHVLVFLLLVLVGCPPPVVPNPPPPPQDTDQCDDAEATLKRLQCLDSLGDPMWVNKNGEPFGDTCRTIQEEALIFIDPACIASAVTCEEANECPTNPH